MSISFMLFGAIAGFLIGVIVDKRRRLHLIELENGRIMDLNDEIARVAYELWDKRGRRHGEDWEDWYQAEIIVRARYDKPRAKVGKTEKQSARTPNKGNKS